jgi:hypothetical protein
MTAPLSKALGLIVALLLVAPAALAADRPAKAKVKTDAPPVEASAEIPFASADAAATTVASAPGAWGGARTGKEATLSDRVVNYEISATLDPVKHTVEGHELLTWRNRSDRPIRTVYLHLYMNAFEGYDSTFYSENRNLGFKFRTDVPMHDSEWGHIELRDVSQGGAKVEWSFVHPDGGPQTDHTVVRFDLPTPVPAGASTVLAIDFHDQLPRVVARTGYFETFHVIGQWFPKIGVLELAGERGATAPRWNVHEFHLFSEFYADYGNFDVKLTVPKDYTVGAVGEEIEPASETGAWTTHHFVQGDVHDFAWTADNQSGVPLHAVYTGPGSPPVTVTVIYPKQFQASADLVLQSTLHSLAYFSKTLGPYPYRTVTAVLPAFNAGEAGGMEYPTFFTTAGYATVEKDTIKYFEIDFTTIHEFGHGYFYGILGSNEFEEPMLDEGLNEFWDERMLRDTGNSAHLTTSWLKRLGYDLPLDGYQLSRPGAMLARPQDGLGANSWNRQTSRSYASVYSRTVLTLHDLEARLGTPVLEHAFQEYYKRWKFRHPGIADLRESLAEASGQRELVERAFAEQVYATQPVDDRVASIVTEEELPLAGSRQVEGKWVETTRDEAEESVKTLREQWKKAHPDAKDGAGAFAWRTTVLLTRTGAAAPQTVIVKFADGTSESVVWNDSNRWARFSWVKTAKGVSAELDPEHIQRLDANQLNNSRTVEADHSPSLRWASDAQALVQAILALIASL